MHANRQEIPVMFEGDGIESRQTRWGDMNVAIEMAPTGMDSRPLFEGLPGNSCQCPHWGYVISGRMRVVYADHEEVVSAGEAYYLEPGHNVVCEEAGELVEFSPGDEYQKTMQMVAENMQAARADV